MSLRLACLTLVTVLLSTTLTLAADVKSAYNYISAAELENRLKSGQPTHVVDIQVEAEYNQHHIKGATPTFAYPVKSDADKAKLATEVPRLKATANPVVIICPRGAGGATRTYDYLLSQGLPAERLLILEKGQEGWTCAPLTEGK